MLSSLPLSIFSFYRDSKRVIAMLVSIQRRFMWFGVLDSKVDWNLVCRARQMGGGGGVKGVELSSFQC